MLVEESLWIKDTISKHFGAGNFPLLNIGSSTGYFRKVTQPFIYSNVFGPLEEDHVRSVIHLDMKMAEGVDMIGDLNDPAFRDKLKSLGVKSVMCSNLLEHLDSPKVICTSITELLVSGGMVIVTVPYEFPFHKDPIDTLFRPTVEELHAYFPGTKIVDSAIIESKRSYGYDLRHNLKYLGIMLIRLGLPFYKFKEWKYIVRDFYRAGHKYSTTCLLLEKL